MENHNLNATADFLFGALTKTDLVKGCTIKHVRAWLGNYRREHLKTNNEEISILRIRELIAELEQKSDFSCADQSKSMLLEVEGTSTTWKASKRCSSSTYSWW